MKLDISKLTINGKDITSEDLVNLMTKFRLKHDDHKMAIVLDYIIAIYENGHNGIYLKSHPIYTNNKKESCLND